jgi:hypothetical protein
MAKKRKLSLDAKLNALRRLVEKGFAAVSQDIAHRPTNSFVGGITANYIPRLVEKVVGPLLDTKLSPVIAELASIRRDLDVLRDKVENVIGYGKEIDYALERIGRIEKHLGIDKHIAA